MNNSNILNFTKAELRKKISDLGLPAYRADQLFIAIHKRRINSLIEAKGLDVKSKELISANFVFETPELLLVTDSKQFNTQKFLFRIADEKSRNLQIETVLINEKQRHTVCVSTQVGCNVQCGFCATGQMGFSKNLTAGEIVSQVYAVSKVSGKEVTNLVFMGMGEPFLNYDNMLTALKILTDADGIGLSSRKITVSTVGFKGRIRKFTDDIVKEENKSIKKIKLALSLHSTDNGIREAIIPTSVKNTLLEIYEELIYYYRKTHNKITYEYIYFPGLNDTSNDIKRLIKLSRMIPSNLNIIPFHPISFELSGVLSMYNNKSYLELHSNEKMTNFINHLRSEGVVVNLRASSGVDINAACGQLAVLKQ